MRAANKKSFTLVEFMIASAIALVLMGSLVGITLLARQIYASGVAEENLQQVANVVLNKILKGGVEPSGNVIRLSEATDYNIASLSNLQFWSLLPNGQLDPSSPRWYYLGSDPQSGLPAILYHHPTASGQDEVIYVAPQGAGLTLRFWMYPIANPPGSVYSNPNVYSHIVVGIDVALSQTVSGRAVNGSATTVVNMRNHPCS